MSLNSRIKDVYASLTTSEKIIADYIKTGVKNEDTITENNTLSEIDEFNQEIGL